MYIKVNTPKVNKNDLLDAVLQKLKLQFGSIEVGFFKGSYTYSNGLDITTIARRNNEGIDVPARPFFLPATDKAAGRTINITVNSIAGGMDEQQALGRAGVLFTGAIQREITNLKEPPNAPLTIKLKGSSNPLIDTGKMRQNVQYKLKTSK